MKGKILKIGTFSEEGNPIYWVFDCFNPLIPAMAMTAEICPVTGEEILVQRIAGYSIPELKAIYEGEQILKTIDLCE